MTKPGPKPTPKAIKALKGTLRARDKQRGVPTPDGPLPELPPGWGGAAPWRSAAVEEWDRIVPLLHEVGVIGRLDRAVLLGYCDAYGRKVYWTQDLAERGAVQMTENGYETARPAVALFNRANDDLRRFGALLGLSPAERERISKIEHPNEDPRIARFFST